MFFFTPRFLNNEVRGKSNRDMYDILGCEQVCVCVRVCVYVRVLHKVVLTVSLIRQSRPYGSGRRAGHLNGVVCPVVVSVVVGVWQPFGVSRIISFLKAFPWRRGFPFVES